MKFIAQRLITFLIASVGVCFAEPETPVAPQSQAAFTAGSSNTWNLDWLGSPHRIYFAKASVDLVNWQMLSVLEFGTGPKGAGIFTNGAPKLFVRLQFYDDPSIESLAQARNADFDNDGVSNLYEVSSLGTNPFLFSSNGSGISDGLQDWDGDGISNADEVALGLDPETDNTAATAGTTARIFAYDDKHRLTGSTSPAATQIFILDAEGNITGQ